MRLSLVGATTLLTTIALAAIIFGGEFHAVSSDAGEHYALIKALMDTHALAFPDAPYLAKYLTDYPPFAHDLAAKLGIALGSGLFGMTVMASICVAIFYLAMFCMTGRIEWRAPFIAAAVTIAYALFRGPVFGRMIVSNYFYGQLVGSAIAVAAMFVVHLAIKRWKPIYVDIFVVGSVQLIVATHLMPAAQLAASYSVLLLVLTLAARNMQSLGRLALFVSATLILTYFNPFSRDMYEIAQFEGGAHINLFGSRWAQFCLLGFASWVSLKLLQSGEDNSARLVVGSLGLGTCCFAIFQMLLFWSGVGSNYAIAKNMFLIVAVSLFAGSALVASDLRSCPYPRWANPAVWCVVLTILTMRADLSPVATNMKTVVQFQHAADIVANRLALKGKKRILIFSTFWPENLSFGLTVADMKFPMNAAVGLLTREFPSADQADYLLAPAEDPVVRESCARPESSNELVTVMDYSCFKASVPNLKAGN